MKQKYTVSARSVIFEVTGVVNVTFRNGMVYKGDLAGLKDFARVNDLDCPQDCQIDGQRHGIYPCLIASDEKIAAALSVLRRERIEVGDGATFSGRKPVLKLLRSMMQSGITVPPDSLKWGVTDMPYERPAQRAVPAVQEDAPPF